MKKQITLRIEEGLLDWFKLRGKGYQSEMHEALEKYRFLNSPVLGVEKYYNGEAIVPKITFKDYDDAFEKVRSEIPKKIIKTVEDIPKELKPKKQTAKNKKDNPWDCCPECAVPNRFCKCP